jgi:hypothetical protein
MTGGHAYTLLAATQCVMLTCCTLWLAPLQVDHANAQRLLAGHMCIEMSFVPEASKARHGEAGSIRKKARKDAAAAPAAGAGAGGVAAAGPVAAPWPGRGGDSAAPAAAGSSGLGGSTGWQQVDLVEDDDEEEDDDGEVGC